MRPAPQTWWNGVGHPLARYILQADVGLFDLMCKARPMGRLVISILAALVVGGIYWKLFIQMTGVREPWDASSYWSVGYPISLVISALAGRLFKAHAWLGGALITLVQFPIIMFDNETGPLWPVGLVFLIVFSIPCAAVSAFTGGFLARSRST